MLKILNQNNSIVNHFLCEMRHKDIQKDRAKFRNNLKRLGTVIAYEISTTLKYKPESIPTPLGTSEIQLLEHQPVIITILRAGLPFLDGFTAIFDQADVGFIGAYRDESSPTMEVVLEYKACTSLEGRTIILVDPMLATGKSVIQSVKSLLKNGTPAHIHIAAAVAAPEGVEYVSNSLNVAHTIWTGAVDERLNTQAYIVPGLGDAGDLSYGSKL